MELHIRKPVSERGPLDAGLLNAVFAEDALALVQDW
jgi:hypothetical protein